MAPYHLLLAGETFFALMSSRTMFKLLTFVNLYCIAFDCYSAFYSVGTLAYCFVLIANLPYLLALGQLLLQPHSIFRRRLVYQVCKLVYVFKFFSDFWATTNLNVDARDDVCELLVYQEPQLFETISAKLDL